MTDPILPPATPLQAIKRNILVGVLALVPLWITITLIGIFLSFVRQTTAPVLDQALSSLGPNNSAFQQLADAAWFQTIFAMVLLLLFFYLIGWLTSRWIGQKLMLLIDQIMDRIPIAKSVYNAIKGVTGAMQSGSKAASKVVLINFPSPELKTIGLVTKLMEDKVTGEELAVVFVPTSPTPTAGYVEIVPVADLIILDWTVEQAMSFLMSGGTEMSSPLTLTKASPRKAPEAKD